MATHSEALVAEAHDSIGDLAMLRQLWLLILVACMAQLPPVASNLFVAVIATDLQTSPALVGGLRGLGGLAALAVGVLVAPLIDRLPRAYSVAAGLLGMAAATGLVSLGVLPALVLFYLAIGGSTAILVPSVQSAGMDDRPGPDGVRGATLLTGVPALAAVAAGPLLALPAEQWGWRADFVMLAGLSLVLAALALGHLSHAPPGGVSAIGYLEAFRQIGAAPGAAALLIGATLRATLLVAVLNYLGPFFSEQFGYSLTGLGLLFGLSGLTFLVANVLGGRLIAHEQITPGRLVVLSLVVAGLAGAGQFLTASPILAVVLCALHTAGHGAFSSGVIGLFVERWPQLRGPLLGLNAAGLNLGFFAGAAIGGIALGLAGYVALAAALALLGALALATTLYALRA